MGQRRRVQISTTSTTLTVRRKQHAAAHLPRLLPICKRCHGGYKNTFTAGSRTRPRPRLPCPPLRHSRVWDHILTACQNMLQLAPTPSSLDSLSKCIALESFRETLSCAPSPRLAGSCVAGARKEPQVYDVICSFMRHTNKVA